MAKGPHTGELRNLVTLQSPSYSADATGQEKPTWSTVATAWAKIEPMSGTESGADGTVEAVVTFNVWIRYNATISAIDESWRVLWGSRTFGIVAAFKTMEIDHWVMLSCREIKT